MPETRSRIPPRRPDCARAEPGLRAPGRRECPKGPRNATTATADGSSSPTAMASQVRFPGGLDWRLRRTTPASSVTTAASPSSGLVNQARPHARPAPSPLQGPGRLSICISIHTRMTHRVRPRVAACEYGVAKLNRPASVMCAKANTERNTKVATAAPVCPEMRLNTSYSRMLSSPIPTMLAAWRTAAEGPKVTNNRAFR